MQTTDYKNDVHRKFDGDLVMFAIASEVGESYNVDGGLIGSAPRQLVINMAANLAASAIVNSSEDSEKLENNLRNFMCTFIKEVAEKVAEEVDDVTEKLLEHDCGNCKKCDH